MFEGLQQALVEYRRWIEEEEKVMADPVKHQQFKQVRDSMPPATTPTPHLCQALPGSRSACHSVASSAGQHVLAAGQDSQAGIRHDCCRCKHSVCGTPGVQCVPC